MYVHTVSSCTLQALTVLTIAVIYVAVLANTGLVKYSDMLAGFWVYIFVVLHNINYCYAKLMRTLI